MPDRPGSIQTVWVSPYIAVQDEVAALVARGLWPARRFGGVWIAPQGRAAARAGASSSSGTQAPEIERLPATGAPSAPGDVLRTSHEVSE